MIVKLLSALSAFLAAPTDNVELGRPAAVDLSAVRYLDCTSKDGGYTGSGFLIGPHTLATARHVTVGDKCIDAETGTEVKAYYRDDVHDFALMSAPGLPTNIPYIHYRCDGIKPGKPYLSYGITDYGTEAPILRMNVIWATNKIDKDDQDVKAFPHSAGMRFFNGFIAPGMSGGPVVDLEGYAVAVNNAGDDTETLLFDLKDTVLCKK